MEDLYYSIENKFFGGDSTYVELSVDLIYARTTFLIYVKWKAPSSENLAKTAPAVLLK